MKKLKTFEQFFLLLYNTPTKNKEVNFLKTSNKPNNNFLFKEIYFKNHLIEILYDTGASMSIIDKKLVNRLNLKIIKCNEVILAPVFSEIYKCTEKTKITLNIENRNLELELLLVDLYKPRIIIGVDVMEKYNFSINFSSKSVHINNKNKINIIEEKAKSNPKEELHTNTLNELMIKYKSIFTSNIKTAKSWEFQIELKKDTEPIALKPYSIPHKQLELVKEEISKLLKNNVITESTSSFAAPAFPIQKRTGGMRLVVDYSKLNNVTIGEHFPLERIQ